MDVMAKAVITVVKMITYLNRDRRPIVEKIINIDAIPIN
jgi:hypothetical protein